MTTELDNVKKKIIAFLAMTDARSGASEAEAMIAAKKMGELMELYNLSLDDLEVRNESVKRTEVSTGLKVKSQPLAVMARAISKYCDCSYYYHTKRGYTTAVGGNRKGAQRWGIVDITWNFVGVGPDAEMAQYLMKSLIAALRADTNRYMASQKREAHGFNRIARSSFEDGFAYRVEARLSELKREREERANQETSRALVTTKNQMIESFMSQEVGKLVYKRTNTTRGAQLNGAAYNAGRNAANNANLSRPVGSEGRNQLMIK